MGDYAAFIEGKHQQVATTPVPHDLDTLPDALFPFQRDIVAWALRRGRAAIFADTGLGKTLIQLAWAAQVERHGRVLILTPLAVAEQSAREAERFGIPAAACREDTGAPITITNYERMHLFDPSAYVGIVLDESSILKAYDGKTRNAIIEAFRDTRWRLACTATPAPNDFTELGNHSEFLGIKSRVEMLAEYFVHDGGSTADWRLKGHAVDPFWRWVCSWAALVKTPSDLGYDDGAFALPPLRFHEHVLPAMADEAQRAGQLFALPVLTLGEQRRARRGSQNRRVTQAVTLASIKRPVLIWAELNDEADAVAEACPDAIQVRGADDPDTKAARLLGFAAGTHRVLVTKPSIAGFGMNWQHCATMIFLGASHSYEQTYQAIRRCWRFGQTQPVDVHVIRLDTEEAIMRNYQRKERDAATLATAMMAHARQIQAVTIRGAVREWTDYTPTQSLHVPSWIGTEEACPS